MSYNEYKEYNLEACDNESVPANKFQCIGKVKRIINNISSDDPVVINLRAYNIHRGYSFIENCEYTDIIISQVAPENDKNSEDYTIKHTNWFLFDVVAYADADYIYIYIRARYRVYGSYIRVKINDTVGEIKFFPTKASHFQNLPSDMNQYIVQADEYSSVLMSRKTSVESDNYIKILSLDTSRYGLAFVLSIYNDGYNVDSTRSYFQQFRINSGWNSENISNTFTIEKMNGEIEDCVRFVLEKDNKVGIYVRNFGSDTRLKFKLSEISNVYPCLNINYINELGKNDASYVMTYCTNTGSGDYNEDYEAVSTNDSCCYSEARLNAIGTILPIARKNIYEDDIMYDVSNDVNMTSLDKPLLGIGKDASSNFYFNLSNEWCGIQFKVDVDGIYARRYYGDSGWSGFVRIAYIPFELNSELYDGSKVKTINETLTLNYDSTIPGKLVLTSTESYDYAVFEIRLDEGTYQFSYSGDNTGYYPDYGIKDLDNYINLETGTTTFTVNERDFYTFRFFATGDNPGTTTYQNISLKRIS